MSEESSKSTKKDKSKAKSIDDMLDPARFRGDGVVFKGKIIGITPVENARGDKMCQEAMQRTKLDVKAAGVHKQKVTIQIILDGMKIIDEKTGKVEHQHPVHRISFISRDITDARAFGYVFGNKDGTHTFFGIKSEKASEHLVLTLRDLFQVVFELKKKEMDKKKEQAEKDKAENKSDKENEQPIEKKDNTDNQAPRKLEFVANREPEKEENVGTLLDLATELESIQQGIQQMNAFEADPFSPPITLVSTGPPKPGLDPFGASTDLWAAPSQTFQASQSTDAFGQAIFQPQPTGPFPHHTDTASAAAPGQVTSGQQGSFQFDKYSAFEELSTLQNPSLFPAGEPLDSSPAQPAKDGSMNPFASNSPLLPKKEQPEKPNSRPSSKPSSKSGSMENLFSHLDPLGGNRPFIPKEEMFADLKAPQKPKVSLKDLSTSNNTADNVRKTVNNQTPTTMLFASPAPSKPTDVPIGLEADFNMPSPQAPPPPLPVGQKVMLPDVAPAPPPRPQQLDTCGIPRLTPPAPVPRQRTAGSKPAATTDPFASDPFFTSSNGTDEALAAFDAKFPSDPFASPVSAQEPIYAIVNKDNRKRES